MRLLALITLVSLPAFAQVKTRIDLVPAQPLYNQITGNCYSHSGNDILSAQYLRSKGISGAVVEPHPLLVAGLGPHQQERGYISGGYTCDYIRESSQLSEEVCSYDALEAYLGTKNPGTDLRHYQDLIHEFDQTLKSLARSLEEENAQRIDLTELKENNEKLIAQICELGALGLESYELTSLLDFSRLLVDHTREEHDKTRWQRLTEVGTRVLAGQRLREAVVSQRFQRNLATQERQKLAPIFLKKFYRKLNQKCLESQRELGLTPVPADFFAPSKPLSCEYQSFFEEKMTQEQAGIMVDTVSEQVKQGFPVPISVCASIFEGYRPEKVKKDYQGECLQEDNHAVTVVGLIELANGHKVFKIKNSWGYNQCDGFNQRVRRCLDDGAKGCINRDKDLSCKEGYYYMSEDLFKKQVWGYGKVGAP